MSARSFRGVRIIRFGDFELDVRAAELRKKSERIRLQEQPFRILTMLLEHPGEVVLREDIRKKLWPNGTIVEVGHGINAAVLRLREALGESAENPVYVETLARRGYRFVGQPEVLYKERTDSSRPPNVPAPAAPAVREFPDSSFDTSDLAGQTISHYQVIEKVGGGGMGVVYRAEDLKLGRQVALKFLPQEMAGDPSALGRFQREARAASALNHPNICTVYGVEEASGQPIIVMEMLEGENLEARLAKGPLPIAKALTMAIQMADALDAAHRRGIVHRDLKPSNILVTRSGVKVLDFGLAKIARAVAVGNEDVSHVTREGAILGTLHYMSPEQVQGKETDAASDIFSFGLVVYEMLAGRRAFPGENSATVMAAILTWDPPELREPIAPAGLDRVLRRCLAKEPEERWHTACDLKAALEWIAAGWSPGVLPLAPVAASLSAVPAAVVEPAPARRPRWVYWSAAGVVVAALGIVLFGSGAHWLDSRPSGQAEPPVATGAALPAAPVPLTAPQQQQPPATSRITAVTTSAPAGSQVTRFTVTAPNNGTITRLNLSPDGRRIAFVSGGRIFIRSFDSLESRAVDGAEGAGTPFWSPDGRFLAYPSGGKLKTIKMDGGLPVTLCEVNTNVAGAWGTNGTIVIGLVGDGLFRIPAAGTGSLTRVTALDPAHNETRHMLPQFLPDGRRFLFVAGSNKASASMLYAGSLDSSEKTAIMPVSSSVQFVAPRRENAAGYLIFVREGILMAQPFDPAKLRTSGDALPIAGAIATTPAVGTDLGIAEFSAAGGTLAYRSMSVRNVLAKADKGITRPAIAVKDGGDITIVQNWMASVKK